MPITKQAIKKLRRDRKRTVANDTLRRTLKRAVKNSKKKTSTKALSLAYSLADKAVKRRLIHKNKARRIKSRLSKQSAK